MSDVFEFAVRQAMVSVDGHGRGETSLDVTSRLGRHEQVTIEVDVRGGSAESPWFLIDPQDLSLGDGETTTVTVGLTVPAGTPPGEYDFALRAYAVSDPQRDFTVSQVLTASVPAQAEPKKVNSWLLVLLAAIALLLIALIVWLFTRGSDDPPPEAQSPADVIAMPVADAVAELEPDFFVEIFPDGSVDSDAGCVLLQTPDSSTESPDGAVGILTTECPTPRPQIKQPTSLLDLCQASFQFCQAVNRTYPDPPNNQAWALASNGMADVFVERFTIPGTEVPSVVGMPNIEARGVLLDAGFEFIEESDGSAGTTCRGEDNQNLGAPVLLQHPFAGVLAADGDAVTLVLTSCPDDANTAEQVIVDTTISLDTFANLRAAVPGFHAAVQNDPSLGPDFLDSAEALDVFTTMVKQLQQRFAIPRVPDIVGQTTVSAEALVSDLDLELLVPTPLILPPPGSCLNGVILTQDPGAGTLVADVADGEVNATADFEIGPCRLTLTIPEVLEWQVITGDFSDVLADDE